MSMNFEVALVIPILNEAASLPELLGAVKGQTLRPKEIIFSDAGSMDGSRELIETWWRTEGWSGSDCRVLLQPGAMPGAGRNAGIRAASSDWIAFLDGGIEPANNWLESLCRQAHEQGAEAVFGVCHFSAMSVFAKSVCALSYGHGSVHPVIPASLFKRTIFDEIGYFPEKLRAGEDIFWVELFVERFGNRNVCPDALVWYTHFPASWHSAIRKWYITEYHCSLAGVRCKQQIAYLLGMPLLYAALLSGTAQGIAVFIAYLMFRGVFDPARRSQTRPWWGNKPIALLIAPTLVTALDLAKWAGIVRGTVSKACKRFQGWA